MHKFFRAVAFVTIFSVATRALGFLLRIYLSRVMGAEMLGSYQIAMSIFEVLSTLVCSGLPLVVSRNVAYYEGKKDKNMQNKHITAGLIISLVLSVVVCALLYIFPQILSAFIESAESVQIINILLPALVASAVYAILRGGLWGRKYFFTISFTEFFEQIVRILACVVLFGTGLFGLSIGQKASLSLTISCFASAALVVVLYFAFGGRLASPKNATWAVIKTSTPITLVRTVSSVVGAILAVIIPLRLQTFGYTEAEALAEFGIFMGMTMPLLMVPNTFISSIAVAMVPSLSGYTNNIDKTNVQNKDEMSRQIMLAVRATIILSVVLMPIFISLGKPICEFLFNSEQAGVYLSACAILMLPMGLGAICSSMLNAIGLEMKCLINYVLGAIVLFLCIYFLPQYIGTYAVFVGMLGMQITTSFLSLKMLKKRNLIDWSFLQTIAILCLICVPTSVLGHLLYSVLIRFTSLFISLAISGIITLTFTILLMFVFDVASISMVVSKLKAKRKNNKICSAQ